MLTAAVGALVMVFVVGIAAFAILLRTVVTNDLENAARTQAAQVAAVIATDEAAAAEALQGVPTQGALLQVIAQDGTVVARSGGAEATPLTTLRPGEGVEVVQLVDGVAGEAEPHVVVVRGVRSPEEAAYVVVVAAPLDVALGTVTTSTALLAAGAVVLTLLVLLIMARVLSSALRPVERITAEVAAISEARSPDRVTVPPSGDEIAMLAGTMNGMLDRLARSDSAMRQFVSDASHELRSPLATLQAMIETSHSGDGGEAVLDRDVALGEVERLGGLVADLLVLTKADDRGLVIRHQEVDLDDVVDAEVRRLRSIALVPVRANIIPVQVDGDPDRLAQILRNLTDNALRHSTGWVGVSMVSGAPGWVEVHVDNAGESVPVELREAVFGRFTRLDEARARDHGGSGLGLPIAATLARAHGGGVTAGETPDGDCRFTLRLPIRPEA